MYLFAFKIIFIQLNVYNKYNRGYAKSIIYQFAFLEFKNKIRFYILKM
nr:MAG TPA: hypothetical protein [Caudoviricetes sp.]